MLCQYWKLCDKCLDSDSTVQVYCQALECVTQHYSLHIERTMDMKHFYGLHFLNKLPGIKTSLNMPLYDYISPFLHEIFDYDKDFSSCLCCGPVGRLLRILIPREFFNCTLFNSEDLHEIFDEAMRFTFFISHVSKI